MRVFGHDAHRASGSNWNPEGFSFCRFVISRFPYSVIAILLIVGCGIGGGSNSEEFAARVGSEYLSAEEVHDALQALPVGLDSITARQQVIEQWVQSRLLAQEAHRQGLTSQEDIQLQLAESERAVLAAALIDRFFEANAEEPTDDEIQAYYETNIERLDLREPYVRIRLLTTDQADEAELGRAAMARARNTAFADSLWDLTVREFSSDPDGALALSSRYLPESRLRGLDETIGRQGLILETGGISEVFESGGHNHVLQVVDRVPAGITPELPWIREELRQRLAIEKRNTMLARQIQQLKNEAESDGRVKFVDRPPLCL